MEFKFFLIGVNFENKLLNCEVLGFRISDGDIFFMFNIKLGDVNGFLLLFKFLKLFRKLVFKRLIFFSGVMFFIGDGSSGELEVFFMGVDVVIFFVSLSLRIVLSGVGRFCFSLFINCFISLFLLLLELFCNKLRFFGISFCFLRDCCFFGGLDFGYIFGLGSSLFCFFRLILELLLLVFFFIFVLDLYSLLLFI